MTTRSSRNSISKKYIDLNFFDIYLSFLIIFYSHSDNYQGAKEDSEDEGFGACGNVKLCSLDMIYLGTKTIFIHKILTYIVIY